MEENVSNHLQPVADHHRVIRLARPPKDYLTKGNILAIQLDQEFQLSTSDKQSIPPHLSVWIEVYTTPEQAYRFLQANSPRRLALYLKVKEIRGLNGSSGDKPNHANILDVIWVNLFWEGNGEQELDNRPGAEGHSGITGLDSDELPQHLTKRQKKLLRKDLRSQLAELASKEHFLLDT